MPVALSFALVRLLLNTIVLVIKVPYLSPFGNSMQHVDNKFSTKVRQIFGVTYMFYFIPVVNTHIGNQDKDIEKMLGNLTHRVRTFHITGIAVAVSVVASIVI